MPNDSHRRSAHFAAEAAALVRTGDLRLAQGLYAEAAALEGQAFAAIPVDKTRTRGILAVSHVALLYKSRHLDAAEQSIYLYLSDSSISPASHTAIKEMLEVVWDEQVLARQDREYTGQELQFAMRGGAIGIGTAPVGVATHTLAAADHLIYRTMEFKGGLALRRHGPPPPKFVELLQARATQPSVGSYRFSVRLIEPPQRELFPRDEQSNTPASVAAFIVELVNAITAASDVQLETLVPDQPYRSVLLKLVRNLVPAPEVARELEIKHLSDGQPTATALMLADPARHAISRAIRVASPPRIDEADEPETSLTGTLRALDLDKNRLEIVTDELRRQPCDTPDDFLDDIVGPLVNKRVVVRGRWKNRRGKRQFSAIDIERV
jgi:hypothetical protein